MMRSEPHPSSTAENSRFSMMAVTAIHQRRANAEARVGGMVEGWETQPEERNAEEKDRQRERGGRKS